MKLIGGLIGFVIMTVIWLQRQRGMKNRLAEFDDGRRCIACHATNMTVADGKARCNQCFHTSDLAALRAAVVTDQQIQDVTRPQ